MWKRVSVYLLVNAELMLLNMIKWLPGLLGISSAVVIAPTHQRMQTFWYSGAKTEAVLSGI